MFILVCIKNFFNKARQAYLKNAWKNGKKYNKFSKIVNFLRLALFYGGSRSFCLCRSPA